MELQEVGSHTKDRFALRPVAYEFCDILGRTQVDPRAGCSEAVLCFIVAGQSNAGNYADVPYTPAHRVENLFIRSGGLYEAVDPLLGATGGAGSWLGRFGDRLIAGGRCDRVILVPVAVGGSTIWDWSPAGTLFERLLVAKERCAALSIEPSGVLWQQGESSHVEAPSAYLTPLLSIISHARANGLLAPWFIGKSTLSTADGVTFITSSGTRAACDAAVDGSSIFAGPDTDTLSGPTYRSAAGGIHFTAAGAQGAAQLWADAIVAAL